MNILLNHYVILILRIFHVADGVLWVGGAIFYLYLLLPAVKSAESAGQKFMQAFGPRFGAMMGVVTTLTILSGALLYARFFAGGIDWIWTTGAGAGFTAGAIAALASYGIGAAILGPTQGKIGMLSADVASAGTPKPEQIAELNHLQSYLNKAYRIDFVLLVIAVLAMATARYL